MFICCRNTRAIFPIIVFSYSQIFLSSSAAVHSHWVSETNMKEGFLSTLLHFIVTKPKNQSLKACYINSCKSAIMLSLGYLWCDVMHKRTYLQPAWRLSGFRVATIKLEPRIKFNHNIICTANYQYFWTNNNNNNNLLWSFCPAILNCRLVEPPTSWLTWSTIRLLCQRW